MNDVELRELIKSGENQTVEFKSWIKAKDTKERISLAVDELVGFSNADGGVVLFGVEDSGEITGCTKYDTQRFIESIYEKTRPSIFTKVEEIVCEEGTVLAFYVQSDGKTYTTSDGRCLKRLGKKTKPFYPDEMGNKYSSDQMADFSGKIIAESSVDDINLLEVYNLKEKLRIRDTKSTLPDMDDMAFLRDLGLVKDDYDEEKLTIAGLLFVGKEASINRLLPQAEVIYLHYSEENLEEYDLRMDLKQPIITVLDRLTEKIQNNNKIRNIQIGLFRLEVEDFSEKVFQEALLNALSHRDYQSQGAIYVKHYPDKLVIENPGAFLDGITAKNIITHPSLPRNKLIAETLQRLKYVQRTGQGVDIIFKELISMGKPYPKYHVFNDAVTLTLESAIEDFAFVKFIVQEQEKQQEVLPLSELMILRYLAENKQIKLSEAKALTQIPQEEVKRSCNNLIKKGLIETAGKNYMLTARVYDAVKSEVEYTRDKTIRYIKAKNMILDYLDSNEVITNIVIQELCGFTKQQARATIDKMRQEGLLKKIGERKGAKYIRS